MEPLDDGDDDDDGLVAGNRYPCRCLAMHQVESYRVSITIPIPINDLRNARALRQSPGRFHSRISNYAGNRVLCGVRVSIFR